MFRRVEKTWRKFEIKEQELATQSINLNDDNLETIIGGTGPPHISGVENSKQSTKWPTN